MLAAYTNARGVQAMLMRLETALNPVAVAGFLSGTVDPYLRGRASGRFVDEGDDVTGPWAPLHPATQEIRSQMGYGAAHPINIRTGELENFITGTDGKTSIHPWGATLTLPGTQPMGELAAKFEHAQRGGSSPSSGRPFPARPVLGMNSRDLLFVVTSLARYIGGSAGRRRI